MKYTFTIVVAIVVFYLYQRIWKPQVSIANIGDGKFAYRFACWGKKLEGIFNINTDAAINYSTGKARFKLYVSDVGGLVINADVVTMDEKDTLASLAAKV